MGQREDLHLGIGDLNATREKSVAYKKHVNAFNRKRSCRDMVSSWNIRCRISINILMTLILQNQHSKNYTHIHMELNQVVISMMHINLLSHGETLQKRFGINKNNPNKQKLIDALNKMIADPESDLRLKRKLESMSGE